MVSSIFLTVCFIVLLFKKDTGIRVMSVACMTHILMENILYYYFLHHVKDFDLSFYMTLCWSLDIALLFTAACVLTGFKKKCTITLSLLFFLLQFFIFQYPALFPFLFSFTLKSSYLNFMEMFIFVFALKGTTVKEWLQTSTIIFSLVVLHFII